MLWRSPIWPSCRDQGENGCETIWSKIKHWFILSHFYSKLTCNIVQCLSVNFLLLLFIHPVMSNSLRPHGLQHARPPCPSPAPEVCPISCSLHQWCHPAISSSDVLFFCPQSSPASGTFPETQLFASDDQNTRVSTLVSVIPTSTQGWFPLRLIGLISLLSQGLSGVEKIIMLYILNYIVL